MEESWNGKTIVASSAGLLLLLEQRHKLVPFCTKHAQGLIKYASYYGGSVMATIVASSAGLLQFLQNNHINACFFARNNTQVLIKYASFSRRSVIGADLTTTCLTNESKSVYHAIVYLS